MRAAGATHSAGADGEEIAMATYEVSTDSFADALLRIVEAFRKENPGIGTFGAVQRDGTKISIRMPKPKKQRATR